jgi:hypothetical protein
MMDMRHSIGRHVIQDYLNHQENASYLEAIYVMEQLQIADEIHKLMQAADKQSVCSPSHLL